MKLSLSMWSVHRTVKEQQWSVLDFLSFCKSEGIDQVELLNVFWRDVEQELPLVIAYLQDNAMKVASYAVSNDFAKETAEERTAAKQIITTAFPIAKALGTSVIRVFAGNLGGSATYETALDWIVDGLSEAAKQAEQEGLVLCLENHGKLAGSGEQMKTILDRVNLPSLRSTFDTGNFLLVDENPLRALDVLLPYVSHVHFKDFRSMAEGRYKSLAGHSFEGFHLGAGDVDLTTITHKLRDAGYQGAFVLEYEGLGSEAEGIRKSFAYFNSII